MFIKNRILLTLEFIRIFLKHKVGEGKGRREVGMRLLAYITQTYIRYNTIIIKLHFCCCLHIDWQRTAMIYIVYQAVTEPPPQILRTYFILIKGAYASSSSISRVRAADTAGAAAIGATYLVVSPLLILRIKAIATPPAGTVQSFALRNSPSLSTNSI